MARKKSREQRKRERAKLREAAKRDGDFEARILQRIEKLESFIDGRLLSSQLIVEASKIISSIEGFYNHMAVFPGRQEAFTGLLVTTGMVQLDIDPNGRPHRYITFVYHIRGGMEITITNKNRKERGEA